MPGKTSDSFSGSVRLLPSSSDLRTFISERSTTALPAVLAVISSPSRMGTPLAISVPNVRVNRATAIFRITIPTTGSFKIIVSSANRPCAVPYQTFKQTTAPTAPTTIKNPKIDPIKLLTAITIFVGNGKSTPKPAKNVAKIGTTFHNNKVTTPPAIVITPIG